MRLTFILVALCFILSCRSAPYTGRKQLSLIPASQLDAMGVQAFNAMLQQQPTTEDPDIVKYIQCVTDPLVKVVSAEHDDAPKEWRLAVMKDLTPNAFALPGGNIGVHVGLLKAAKTDEQLATVIGHELGHVLANHSGERVSQNVIAQGGLALTQGFLLSDMSPQKRGLLMAALGVGAQVGVLLPFSRTQESESDIIGLNLMARAGFDPRQSVDLWRNMMAETQGGQPPEFMSTHPAPEARIEKLQESIPAVLSVYENAKKEQGRTPASECKRPTEKLNAIFQTK